MKIPWTKKDTIELTVSAAVNCAVSIAVTLLLHSL